MYERFLLAEKEIISNPKILRQRGLCLSTAWHNLLLCLEDAQKRNSSLKRFPMGSGACENDVMTNLSVMPFKV